VVDHAGLTLLGDSCRPRAAAPRRTVVSKPVVDGLRCQIQSLRDVLQRSALLPGKLTVEELL
jgi:hypothetical protein